MEYHNFFNQPLLMDSLAVFNYFTNINNTMVGEYHGHISLGTRPINFHGGLWPQPFHTEVIHGAGHSVM